MKILVTGAAGSLGRKLIDKLITNNANEIYATDIKSNPFGHVDNLHYKSFDLRSGEFTEWVREICPTKIIHLASILQLSKAITREIAYEIDVKATEKLLKTCIELNVEKFIITTSGAAYGYYPENKNVITEKRPTRGNKDYFYSAHKAKIEELMADYRINHPELKQIVFRPGAILGPDFEGPVVNFFRQKMITGIIGYAGSFNFIWSADVVDFIIEGVDSDITGQFNIAGDGLMTLKEIAQRLNKVYLPLPALFIQTVLTVGRFLGLTQYGPEQLKFIKYRPILDNRKLKATFNHQPKYNTPQALDAFLQYQQEK